MSTTLLNPLDKLAGVAEASLGLHEAPRGSNRGPQLAAFFAADDYRPNGKAGPDEGYPWCACAVSLWVQLFLAMRDIRPLFPQVKAPHLSAAFAFLEWGRDNGAIIFTPASVRRKAMRHQRGNIVAYGFSHIGIVKSVNVSDTNFSAIEGNTDAEGSREGWQVACRARTLGDVSLKRPEKGCFIRLTPSAQPVGGVA